MTRTEPPSGMPMSMPTRLDRMIDERLGPDYAPDKRTRLGDLAALTEHEQEKLVSALQSERITREQYLERFARLVGDLLAGYELILGRVDFIRLFGVPPEHALDFLDPELFSQAHDLRN